MNTQLVSHERPNDPARQVNVYCIDLDGTLIRSDVLSESAVRYVVANPLRIFTIIYWLLQGKAYLKEKLAEHCPPQVALLPYNTELLEWLKVVRSEGNTIVLVTATHRVVAESVAEFCGIFDEVMATEGSHNLKGQNKAKLLLERYGRDGFIYAGNCHSDLPIWQNSCGYITVGKKAKKIVASLTDSPHIKHFDVVRKPQLRTLPKLLRVHQWVKNILVFTPLLTSLAVTTAADWLAGLLAFISFSITASGVYIINDAGDLESDRNHPRKRKRPFASNDLAIEWVLLGPVLLLGGIAVAWLAHILPVVLLYVLITFLYTAWLKRIALIDVFCLSGLYLIRIIAGGFATGHYVSIWLLGFSGFFFLGLALMKRFTEIRMTDQKQLQGRGYTQSDELLLCAGGIGTSIASAVILSLYIDTTQSQKLYAHPAVLWMLVPLMLFWGMRMWRKTLNHQMTDDPIVFAAKDKVTIIIGLLSGCCLLLASNIMRPLIERLIN